MMRLLFVFAIICFSFAVAQESMWVCEAGDELVLGEYVRSEEQQMDGVDVYSNANELSIFRNKGFWYIGNLV